MSGIMSMRCVVCITRMPIVIIFPVFVNNQSRLLFVFSFFLFNLNMKEKWISHFGPKQNSEPLIIIIISEFNVFFMKSSFPAASPKLFKLFYLSHRFEPSYAVYVYIHKCFDAVSLTKCLSSLSRFTNRAHMHEEI